MSVVTEEALNVALISYHRTRPHEGAVAAMRSALAAVAPLIRRVALEDAAKYHDEAADGERDLAGQCGAQNDRRGNEMHKYLEQEHILSAAALRALT